MKYRFSAAIFVRGGRAFIEIPFNVREEAGGQIRNFGEQTVRGRARPATAWGARRASGAGSRPQGRRPGRAGNVVFVNGYFIRSTDRPVIGRYARQAGDLAVI